MEVDPEFLALVERVKELKGNPALSFQEAFEFAMQEYVQKRDKKKETKTVAQALGF